MKINALAIVVIFVLLKVFILAHVGGTVNNNNERVTHITCSIMNKQQLQRKREETKRFHEGAFDKQTIAIHKHRISQQMLQSKFFGPYYEAISSSR